MAKAEPKVASVDAPATSDDGAATPAATPPPEQDKPAAMAAPPPSLADARQQERSAKNAIYAEGLGAGIYYSINYERAFGDFSGRLGFGYVSLGADVSSGTSSASASASFISVPITVSYLGIGSKTHMFELGAGATIMSLGAGASGFGTNSSSASATLVLGDVITGYRLQPADGGFFLRAGLNTLVGLPKWPVIPWPAIALGGTF
jgi:hypothetical protein